MVLHLAALRYMIGISRSPHSSIEWGAKTQQSLVVRRTMVELGLNVTLSLNISLDLGSTHNTQLSGGMYTWTLIVT